MTHESTKTTIPVALQVLRDAIDKAERQGVLKPFWDLVTALRGPDTGCTSPEQRLNDTLKRTHTTEIRRLVLTAEQARATGVSWCYPGNPVFKTPRPNECPPSRPHCSVYRPDASSWLPKGAQDKLIKDLPEELHGLALHSVICRVFPGYSHFHDHYQLAQRALNALPPAPKG